MRLRLSPPTKSAEVYKDIRVNEIVERLVELNKELVGWLNTQRGMIPRDYARDLAKVLSEIDNYKEDVNG
jgi:hypothetical protein